MPNPKVILIAVGVALLAVGIYWFIPRSGQGQTGPSDFDRANEEKTKNVESISGLGGRVTRVHFPQGDASAVNLNGVNITDDLITQLGKIGPISELNLSKSTVTDDQLGKMTKLYVPTFIVKFDLSHTGITDAGLEQLDNMIALSQMNLVGTKVTPAGVEKFKRRRSAQKANLVSRTTYKLN